MLLENMEIRGPFPSITAQGSPRKKMTPVRELVEAVAAKELVLLHDRLVGDSYLMLPAQHATTASINFMAVHGRGVVAIVLTNKRAKALGLSVQRRTGPPRRIYCFRYATPIDARDGVTTGISASERALTAIMAADPNQGREQFQTPGHLITIVVRPGIVGQPRPPEAALHLCRLAGLRPAALICALLDGAGNMAGVETSHALSQQFGLKIGSITDLVQLRCARGQ